MDHGGRDNTPSIHFPFGPEHRKQELSCARVGPKEMGDGWIMLIFVMEPRRLLPPLSTEYKMFEHFVYTLLGGGGVNSLPFKHEYKLQEMQVK